jgi:acyl carrier protein
MNQEQLLQTVLDALCDVAPETNTARLRPDRSLRDQIDIDSMDFLNFIIGLHERTGVDIPERDYPKLATINACVAYLSSHVATT